MARGRIKRCLESINRCINICSYLQLLSEKHKHLTHTPTLPMHVQHSPLCEMCARCLCASCPQPNCGARARGQTLRWLWKRSVPPTWDGHVTHSSQTRPLPSSTQTKEIKASVQNIKKQTINEVLFKQCGSSPRLMNVPLFYSLIVLKPKSNPITLDDDCPYVACISVRLKRRQTAASSIARSLIIHHWRKGNNPAHRHTDTRKWEDSCF